MTPVANLIAPPATPFEGQAGSHNSHPEESRLRLIKGASYRDASTVMVLPTPTEFIHRRVEGAMYGLIRPMNQKFAPFPVPGNQPMDRIQVCGFEVGDAYNQAISHILGNPELSKWRFMLTVEHDNLPPPDGLLKLVAAMYEHCEKDEHGRAVLDERGHPKFKFAGIGGLYWTKGEGGMPMIYGNPNEPTHFRPQLPIPDSIQECRGIAMGFTLWNLGIFKDPRLGPPWFETKGSWDPSKGIQAGTQDLAFCGKALQYGYRFAVATNVKVGHLDFSTGQVW